MSEQAIQHDPGKLKPAWSKPFEEFVGPHLVSARFAVDGRDGDSDFVFDAGHDLAPLWRSEDGYAVHSVPDFDPATVVLVKDGETVGFYMGGELWLDVDHRGKGLAPEMVLACLSWIGELPFDTESGMGFSQEGLRAHASAHAKAVALARDAGLDVPQAVVDEYPEDAAPSP